MWSSKKSVDFSIVVCSLVAVVLLGLLFFGPEVFWLYMTDYRGIEPTSAVLQMLKAVFTCTFYPAAVFAAVILFSLIKMLLNIRRNEVFIDENVKCLKVVSWCCVIIGIITLVGGWFYMPFLFVACAGFFVGLLLRVLKNVMQKAVEIKEENDLTV